MTRHDTLLLILLLGNSVSGCAKATVPLGDLHFHEYRTYSTLRNWGIILDTMCQKGVDFSKLETLRDVADSGKASGVEELQVDLMFRDAWGHDYHFQNGMEISIWSAGLDGNYNGGTNDDIIVAYCSDRREMTVRSPHFNFERVFR